LLFDSYPKSEGVARTGQRLRGLKTNQKPSPVPFDDITPYWWVWGSPICGSSVAQRTKERKVGQGRQAREANETDRGCRQERQEKTGTV
jgi:hypothetical protein